MRGVGRAFGVVGNPRIAHRRVVPVAAHNQSAAEVTKYNAIVAPTATASSNWSGYAVTGAKNSVSYVAGSWVVPTANTKTNGYSSVWVGIDGFSSSTVEQIGTDADVVNGSATYYAWYEMYPSPSMTIAMTVRPGDSITGSVTYAGNNGFTLTIKDVTESETFTKTLTAAGAARSSAEWIVEAPSSNYGVLPLANFGTVTFTNADATINGATDPINYWQSYAINMESGSRVEASTSALSDSGTVSSFTVTYNATSTVTPAPTPPQGHGWGGGWGGWGGWGWRQPNVVSQVAVGRSGSSSQLAALGDQFLRDQLFASSEMFDLSDLRV